MNTKASDVPLDKNTAVIVGVGQYKADIPTKLTQAQGPVYMAAQAVNAALNDVNCAAIKAQIDTVLCVRTFGDSGPLFTCPFDTSKNMPAAIGRAVGIKASRNVYDVIGGHTPQSLIAEAAEEIEAQASKVILICGGEAIANMKAAMRAGATLDWSDGGQIDAPLEDRGPFAPNSPPLISRSAMGHQFYKPIQYYTLLENARRAKQGTSREDYRLSMSKIMAGLLKTSRQNPLSFFSNIDPDLNSITPANPLFTDIYSKSILPKDGVNLGAAIIMTSYGRAVGMGLDPARFIYLQAHVEGSESPVLGRPELDKSPVLKACVEQALNAANIAAKDITLRDLYSCFPIVLKESSQALGLDIYKDDLTLTGGLAFFGNAGNNYVLHGIADMVDKLRSAQRPDDFGLIHANGGFMSKHAVGIYSKKPAQYPTPIMRHIAEDGPALKIADSAQGQGIIETFCVDYKKNHAVGAMIIGRLKESGCRFYARPHKDSASELINWLIEADPFGEVVNVSPQGTQNYFTR